MVSFLQRVGGKVKTEAKWRNCFFFFFKRVRPLFFTWAGSLNPLQLKVQVAQSCWFFATLRAIHIQSVEFSRPEYWSLSLLQGILPTQGSNPGPHCRRITNWATREALCLAVKTWARLFLRADMIFPSSCQTLGKGSGEWEKEHWI